MASNAQAVPDFQPPWEQPTAPQPPKPKRKITKKNITKLQEQAFLDHADELLALMVKGIKHQLANNNVEILKKCMEMMNWVQAPRGISIVNQLAQQNNVKGENDQAGGPVYFESIVRKLDKRGEALAQLAAPQAEIIEADVISEQDNSDDD